MHKIDKMSRTDDEIQFNERFSRLKLAFKVKTDSELSKILKIQQQSVSGAKRRCQIPVSWLEVAGARGISLDYIFFGKFPVIRDKNDEATDQNNEEVDPIKMIAEQLVSVAIEETGFVPSQSGKMILERFVKRKVAGDIKSDIIEMLKDVMMSERESEKSFDTD